MFKVITAYSKINESIGDTTSTYSKCPIKSGSSLGIENSDDLLQWFFDIYKDKAPELFQYVVHYVEYSSNRNKMEMQDTSKFWHFASCYIDGDEFFKTEEAAKLAAKKYLSNREMRDDSYNYKFSIRKYKVMTVKQFVQQVLLNKAYRESYKCTTLADITTAKD